MPLILAVAVLSAAAIGYEILLMRLFSIVLWHHYAFMIISVALLGVGASGSFLSLARGPLLARFRLSFAAFATAFGITSVACFALAQRVPFNPLEVVWGPDQFGYLLALYLILAVPFFCSATCIGMALSRGPEAIAGVYRADLMGGAAGAAAVIGLLFLLAPGDSLRVIGALGPLAAAVVALGGLGNRRYAAALLLLSVACLFVWPRDWVTPRPSPYKGLSLALQAPGSKIIAARSSPLGQIAVVHSPRVPIRYAPGLSLRAEQGPGEQLGVFVDGSASGAIIRFEAGGAAPAYLGEQTAALPYFLISEPRVLVLGAGGGAEVLRALALGARSVDAVELDQRMVDLVAGELASFAGHIYQHPRVRIHVAEARGFAEGSRESWDIIQLALLDSYSASAAGVLSLKESPLYTVEGLTTFIARLAPGGLFSITRWLRVPPRDGLKMFATAVAALRRLGVADPGARLALIRGWSTSTLVVKNGALREAEIAAVRRFAAERSFDLAYLPGMNAAEANRLNRLDRPYLYDGAVALLGTGAARFLADYKFDVAPATDDRPYFFRFFKWRLLPEIIEARGRALLVLLEGGYLVQAATLIQALLTSAVLVLLPLAWLRPGREARAKLAAGRVAAYFMALGLGFLFVEIAFIQRFTLFLGHPLYAVAVVLVAFLLFAGLGSGAATRIAGRLRRFSPWPIAVIAAGIIVLIAAYLVLLPVLFSALIAEPPLFKAAVSVLLIAPLAFQMGMPFPLGLERVAVQAPRLVPWAWGINGCASVLSAVLAGLLATHLGLTALLLLAMALYALAAVAFAR